MCFLLILFLGSEHQAVDRGHQGPVLNCTAPEDASSGTLRLQQRIPDVGVRAPKHGPNQGRL